MTWKTLENVMWDMVMSITRSEQFGLASLRMARRLEQGFIVTVEPGIYFIPPLIEKWEAEKTVYGVYQL